MRASVGTAPDVPVWDGAQERGGVQTLAVVEKLQHFSNSSRSATLRGSTFGLWFHEWQLSHDFERPERLRIRAVYAGAPPRALSYTTRVFIATRGPYARRASRIEDLSRFMGQPATQVTQDIYIHVRDDMYDRFFRDTRHRDDDR